MFLFSSLPSSLILASFLLAVTSCLPVGTAAAEFKQLTPEDFSSSTKKGTWLVEFFSPYCGHCKHFIPTWTQLIEHVDSQEDLRITLAQVNCIAYPDLCHDEDIQAWPTLRIYRDGRNIEEFDGDRELDRLIDFTVKHGRKPSGPTPNPEGAVLALNSASFQSTVANGPVFVKFFAPWCGHCKKLAPTWVQFASSMKGKVNVAEVNCDDHKSLCNSQKVQGYPTIIFYQHGRILDYTGSRKLPGLVSFAESALAPPLSSMSIPELKDAVQHHDVIYALVHDGLDATLQDNVEEAAQPLHGSPKIVSVHSSSDLLASLHLKSTQLPTIVSLKDHSMSPFEKLPISSSSSIEIISNWLMANALPPSIQLEAENFAKVMGQSPAPTNAPKRLVVLTALDSHDSRTITKVKDIAHTWHREHSHSPIQIMFTWMDKEKWADWLKSVYGVKKQDHPVVVIVDHGRLLYYDSMADGSPIPLDLEDINMAFEGIQSGIIRAKHSENIAERFARRINNWFTGIYSWVLYHPILAVFMGILVVIGIVIGLKRLLEDDARRMNSSVYVNAKSGGRLD